MMVSVKMRQRGSDERFMSAAIYEAMTAAKEGNAPIGSVITRNARIVERGHNKVFTTRDITAHAEIVAIRKLTKRIGSFDLRHYTLYSTFVPCAMCVATVLRANIPVIVYGAEAEDAPQFSSGIHNRVNHSVCTIAKRRVRFRGGILRVSCARLLARAKSD
jgi:tRNA(Arg) A34 adenosine deaminase TadA